MLFQVRPRTRPASLGTPADRAHNFSLLALGYSISGILGPLVAGFTIDHGGFVADVRGARACCRWCRRSCSPQASSPCPDPIRRMRTRKAAARSSSSRITSCAACSSSTCSLAVGWDLHTIVIPVYGARIGLSASQIGLILASFAAATFVVRFSMRWACGG